MTQTTLINDIYGVVGSKGEITDFNIDGKNVGLVRALTSPDGGARITNPGLDRLPGKVPEDFKPMFHRPVGDLRRITVPSPYNDVDPWILHPSALFVPGGFGGYEYWMAYTPMSLGNSMYENPCICASHDGLTWVLPDGAPNPIVGYPGNPAYNSDTHLTITPDGSQLVIVYRTRNEATKNRIKVVTSANGVQWSAPVVVWEGGVGSSDFASPSLYFDPTISKWVMIGHNLESAGREVRRITSSDLLSGWDVIPTNLTFPEPAGKKWWHSWFTRLPSGRLVGVAQDNMGGSNNGEIYICQSVDGLKFEHAKIKTRRLAYRSTAFIVERYGKVEFDVIYSYTGGTGYLESQRFESYGGQSDLIYSLAQHVGSALQYAEAAPTANRSVLVADDFKRADAVTLGADLLGKVWTYADGTNLWGISNGKAYNTTTGNCIALIDTGQTSYRAHAVLAAAPVSGQGWLTVNRLSSAKFWRIGFVNLGPVIQFYDGTLQLQVLPGQPLAVPGRTLSVDVSGQSARFYIDGFLVYETEGALHPGATTVAIQAAGAEQTLFDAVVVTAF